MFHQLPQQVTFVPRCTVRDEFDRKKGDVEKMLIDLVLKVNTTVPKARLE